MTTRLIALMLGRLEMDVDERISAYKEVIEAIFKKQKFPMTWDGKIKGRFDSTVLADAIKETINKTGRSESEKLNDGNARACRV
jgi:hypothetical protein